MSAPDIASGDDHRTQVLRASIRARCEQIPTSVRGLSIVMAVIVASLWHEIPAERLALWMLPLMLSVGWRGWRGRRISPRVDHAPVTELRMMDRSLRANSLVNQLIVGSGMWSVALAGSHETALFVTLAVALYAVGAMVNLSTDYRSLKCSLPLAMGQPCIYWVLEGGQGWGVAASLALLSMLMLEATRRSDTQFAESVRMRFERADLLERLQQEHARAMAALADADAANRAKSAFLAAASHDLRQPLYAISLLADTLALKIGDADNRVIIARQQQAIGVLRGLFDNLLDLARFESGKVDVHIQEVALDEIVLPLAAQFAPLAEEKGLAWRLDESPCVTVHTDPGLVQRLLGNLLSNAVRHTEAGFVSLTIHMLGERIECNVIDTGPGIPPEAQSQIFDEFVQLANSQRAREQGIGLGLAIARHISGLLDARLAVDSTPGKGSCFSFSLPLSDTRAEAQAAWSPGFPQSLRVWVLEDEALVADALRLQLEAWGCECMVTDSVTTVLAWLEHESMPDALVLDDIAGSPASADQWGGLEVATEVRRRSPKVRIVILTGNVDPARHDAIAQAGFDLLIKPVAAEVLVNALCAVEPALVLQN